MSEYQYYEFLALDRPLNATEKAYVQSLSSRVELTLTVTVQGVQRERISIPPIDSRNEVIKLT